MKLLQQIRECLFGIPVDQQIPGSAMAVHDD